MRQGTYKALQQCLEAGMKGTLYAAHCPDSEGGLLQLLQPEFDSALKTTKFKQGKFGLSQEKLQDLMDDEKDWNALVEEATETSSPFNKTITLATSKKLSAGAKVSAAEVPVTVVASGSTGKTVCAHIKLNNVTATKLERPTDFLDTHFAKPSKLMKKHKTQASWWGGKYLRFYVVTAVYRCTFDIETTAAWRNGVEAGVEAGVETLPPLVCRLFGCSEGEVSVIVESTQKQLIAVRVMKVEYNLKREEVEISPMSTPSEVPQEDQVEKVPPMYNSSEVPQEEYVETVVATFDEDYGMNYETLDA